MNPNILPEESVGLKYDVRNMQLMTFPVHPPQAGVKVVIKLFSTVQMEYSPHSSTDAPVPSDLWCQPMHAT